MGIGQDAGALVRQLQSGDAPAQKRAQAELVKLGPASIPALFARLAAVRGAGDVVAQTTANLAVQAAGRPGSEAVRRAMAVALLKEAEREQPLAARRYALELLSYVAGSESVSALAALLKDSELAEMARWALARVPGEATGRALIAAISSARGELKVGLIAALGQRRARSAVRALNQALRSDEEAVRLASLQALGRIADPASESTLRAPLTRGSERERMAAADSYLELADSLAPTGGRGRAAAARIYRWAVEKGPEPAVKIAGIVGLARLGGSNLVEALVGALGSPDAQVRQAASTALVEVPGIDRHLDSAARRAKPEIRQFLETIAGRRRARSGP